MDEAAKTAAALVKWSWQCTAEEKALRRGHFALERDRRAADRAVTRA